MGQTVGIGIAAEHLAVNLGDRCVGIDATRFVAPLQLLDNLTFRPAFVHYSFAVGAQKRFLSDFLGGLTGTHEAPDISLQGLATLGEELGEGFCARV